MHRTGKQASCLHKHVGGPGSQSPNSSTKKGFLHVFGFFISKI